MRQIGRENDLEKINRVALKMAREVADDTGTIMAGGICNTNCYIEGNMESEEKIRSMFVEQVLINYMYVMDCDGLLFGQIFNDTQFLYSTI